MLKSMPYDDRNEDTGKFNPKFTDEDFLRAIEQSGHASTSEIRDRVGCAHRTAYNRLTQLEDEGRITSRDAGNLLLWSIPEDDEE